MHRKGMLTRHGLLDARQLHTGQDRQRLLPLRKGFLGQLTLSHAIAQCFLLQPPGW